MELLDEIRLVLRQHLGKDPVDPDILADTLRHRLIVTAHHRCLDAEFLQLRHSSLGRRFDGVGHADHGGSFAVDCQQNHGLTSGKLLVNSRLDWTQVYLFVRKQTGISNEHAASVDRCLEAMTRDIQEIFTLGVGGQFAPRRFCLNCDCQRMAGALLGGGQKPNRFVFIGALSGVYGTDRGPAFCQRPSLIEGDGRDSRGAFEGRGIFDQNIVFRAQPRPHGDRCRSRQAQGIRTGDHERGDSKGERSQEGCPTPITPGDKSNDSDTDRHDNQVSGGFVGQPLPRGFGVLRRLDELCDPCQRRLLPHPGGLELNGSGPVDGTRNHGVSRFLFDRQAFAGDQSFVYGGLSLGNLPVYRDAVAGPQCQDVPFNHFRRRHLSFHPAANHPRFGRNQFEEGLESI